jgi:hypothetical protein
MAVVFRKSWFFRFDELSKKSEQSTLAFFAHSRCIYFQPKWT